MTKVSQFFNIKTTSLLILLVVLAVIFQAALTAATSTLPITAGLTIWRDFSLGPLALTISITALIAVIGSLAFAGDLSMAGRVFVPLILCVGFVVLAGTSLTAFFGTTAAVI